jgi:hypothetical protein
VILTVIVLTVHVADAQSAEEVQQALRDAAATYGTAAGPLLRIVACETGGRWNADALGDRGHSHGIAQLNDAATGLLAHFHAQGYSSPYNVAEAADYLARVAVGTWARDGITLRRWSCYR